MTKLEGNIAQSALLIVGALLSFRQFLIITRDPRRDWIYRNGYSRFSASSWEGWALRLKFGYLSFAAICVLGASALLATA